MPRKPDSDVPRNVPIQFRVTPDEHASYTAAATKDGKPVSAWLRWLAEQRVIAQAKKRK